MKLRRNCCAGFGRAAFGSFAAVFVSAALIQAASAQTVPFPAPTSVSTTLTPSAQLAIPAPAPPLPNPPSPTGTGTWTFGEGGGASASANISALNPQLGHILQYSVGASTTYNSLNAVVTSPLNPIGHLASVADTLTASGLGLTATGTGGPYFYCVYSPCSSQMVFKNYNDSSQVTATQIVYSPTIPWTGDATAFVQEHQSLYGAQTVTLKMSTSVTNQAGTVSGYSVTGPYQASVGRALVPWTTDDVVHGTILPNAKPGQEIGKGNIVVNPKPQLGFTAQQAAALSGYASFNYLQEYTATGQMNFTLNGSGELRNPTIASLVKTPGAPLNDLPPNDTRRIGDIDPGINGNPARPADGFDLYYDQTKVTATNGRNPGYNVFDDATNFGLNFLDAPNLAWKYANQTAYHGLGSFVTFETELVGVTMTNMSSGATTVTYSPLTSSVDGTVDPTTIFNWMWVQTKADSTCLACGNSYVSTGNPEDPTETDDGLAIFLGLGVMTPDQIDAAIYASLPDIAADLVGSSVPPSAVPEPSTWAMMALGFAGLGCAAARRRRRVST